MYNMPFTQMINLDLLMIEIAQGVSGTIAIALAIPITALLASRILPELAIPGSSETGPNGSGAA
jgi:uncharacterized membrane protein